MKNKKLLIVLIAVMLVQLIVPLGFAVNSKITYNKVKNYGREYKMVLDYLDLGNYYEESRTYDLYLRFKTDESVFDYELITDNTFIKEINDSEAIFTKAERVKKTNNYISKMNDFYYCISYKQEQIDTDTETFIKALNNGSIKDGAYAMIKVYKGKAVISAVYHNSERLIALDTVL